ncbi:MAG: chromosome segregation protein SMC [Candidatus Caenarcaniphilales bacterium]|nr:chromosome segregation protein SMC [Candidatus Caenarcaniphilales bacterium]
MYIESVELDNFKSFGGKALIPLFPGFTTISGPNGSGKSNIIDSLLFCFGLSTNKTMRAERVTDLMNNLSGKKETIVTVTLFDERTETQLKIARRIRLRLNGEHESTYFINEKITTLSQVHEELALKSISSQAFNIVMQGDVTRIITMSPLERRRIIDELAGVAHFDRKIEEAKGEIAQALDSLEKQSILLAEFTERQETLQKERNQALQYSELRTRRAALERLFRKARIKELEDRLSKLVLTLEGKAQVRHELQEHVSQASQNLHDLEQKALTLQNKLDYLNNNQKQKQQQITDQSREKVAKTSAGIEYLHKQILDYEKQIERIKKESALGQQKIEQILQSQKAAQEEFKIANKDFQKIDELCQSLQQKILSKSQSDNLATSHVFELQEAINQLQNQRSEWHTQEALLEQNLTRLEEEIPQLRKELEKALYAIKQTETKAQNPHHQAISEKVNSSQSYLRRLKDELADTEQEIKDRTTQLHEYQNELHKLDLKKQVSEEGHWGKAIDAIIAKKNPGVHGILAQLAQVPSQYGLALEIVAGNRLKGIVVEDDQTASDLIEFLRNQKLGRATFLPLNKLRPASDLHLSDSLKRKHPTLIDYAINLIGCEDLYYNAFAYAFGSTVIVKDLEGARGLIGQYRMVTLQGDLLEKTGAMTGGSQQTSLRFGSDDNQRQKQLQDQIRRLQERLNSLQGSLLELKAEIKSTEDDLDQLKGEYAKLKAEEEVNATGLHSQKEQIERLRERLNHKSAERDQITEILKKTKAEAKNFQQKLSKLSDELVRETARVKDSGLEALVNESQELEFERKQKELTIRNLESQQVESNREIEIIKGGIHRGEAEIEQAKSQILQLKVQVTEQDNLMATCQKDLHEAEKNLHQTQSEIDALNATKDEFASLQVELTRKKTELIEALKRLLEELEELKTKQIDLEERLLVLKSEGENQDDPLTTQSVLKPEDEKLTPEEVKLELDRIERKMNALEPVNMKAITEYDEVSERIQQVEERCQGLQTERAEIEKRIDNYTDHKYRSFMEAYHAVNKHFQEIFAELSFGQGELSLENPENPFQGGLYIQARPRNKKMQRLESMSGGEKSLTALSFIFALQWYNPAPFYAFDEVDMFLDGLNAERLAKMVKKQSQLAQFLVVSLRKPMLMECERAIGVCLGKDGFSRVAGMKSKEQAVNPKQTEHALAS